MRKISVYYDAELKSDLKPISDSQKQIEGLAKLEQRLISTKLEK